MRATAQKVFTKVTLLHKDSGDSYEHFVHRTTRPAIFTEALLEYFGHAGNRDLHSFTREFGKEVNEKHGVSLNTDHDTRRVLENMQVSAAPELQTGSWRSWQKEKNEMQAHPSTP
jgi:hypothetical protein